MIDDKEIIIVNVGHADELLAEQAAKEPSDKRSKAYKNWRKDYNKLVDAINKVTGWKRYSQKI